MLQRFVALEVVVANRLVRVTSPSNVQFLQTLRFCFRSEDLRNWPLESYSDPDKYLSFSIGGKEKWHFFTGL